MDIASQLSSLTSSPEKLLATVTRYAPPLVCVLLVALIAWLLASTTWLLVPRGENLPPPLPAGPVAQPDAGASAVDVQGIVARSLFGNYQAVADVPAEIDGINPEDADISDLPLVLLGTLASDNEDDALAIIEENGEAHVWAIGDTITRGAVLKTVTAREVYFTRAGLLEKLVLPRESEDGGAAPQRPSRSTRARREPAPRAANDSGNLSASAQKLGDFIRPQPVFANGKQRGYRVYPGRKREQFSALGLKPGDLVTEINGTPLDDPSRGLEVFRSISSASQVSVTIERNGAPTSLVLDTSQLSMDGAAQ